MWGLTKFLTFAHKLTRIMSFNIFIYLLNCSSESTDTAVKQSRGTVNFDLEDHREHKLKDSRPEFK